MFWVEYHSTEPKPVIISPATKRSLSYLGALPSAGWIAVEMLPFCLFADAYISPAVRIRIMLRVLLNRIVFGGQPRSKLFAHTLSQDILPRIVDGMVCARSAGSNTYDFTWHSILLTLQLQVFA